MKLCAIETLAMRRGEERREGMVGKRDLVSLCSRGVPRNGRGTSTAEGAAGAPLAGGRGEERIRGC